MAELIAPEAARRLVLERTERLPAEAVPLEHALDRVLAAEARAREPVPAFDNSAMDGLALRAGDVASACDEAPVSLPVIDESRAGRPAGRSLAPGAKRVERDDRADVHGHAVLECDEPDARRSGQQEHPER